MNKLVSTYSKKQEAAASHTASVVRRPQLPFTSGGLGAVMGEIEGMLLSLRTRDIHNTYDFSIGCPKQKLDLTLTQGNLPT